MADTDMADTDILFANTDILFADTNISVSVSAKYIGKLIYPSNPTAGCQLEGTTGSSVGALNQGWFPPLHS